MDGFRVMPMADAGGRYVLHGDGKQTSWKEHFLKMKDGVLVCNSGHFNVELDSTAHFL